MRALVARTIRRRALFGPDDRVAVAVSGGPDSVALACVLHDLSRRGGPPLAGMIHLNHELRGADADGDEVFCRDLARRLELPIDVESADVRALARDSRTSIEVAARRARYACFERAAVRLGATVVATGHTLDDQAETVLLRLLRGASARGASAIRPRRGLVARPLIDTTRATVLRYLRTIGMSWREDASNADVSIPRNRIRHELMPVIARIAPTGPRALARFADLASDDEAALTALAIEMLPVLVLSSEGAPRVEFDARTLAAAPAALGRRAIRSAAEQLVPDRSLGIRHIEAVRRLASTDTPDGSLDLPGLVVQRLGVRLALSVFAPPGRPAKSDRPFRHVLPVPGSVSIPEAGIVMTARLGSALEADRNGRNRVMLQADAVAAPLIVRSRRSGDRMRPLGAPGRRKVQDVLVDRKVPRASRDLVPIVEDANGCVLWVAGVAVAEAGRVRRPEAGVVILEMRKDR